MSLTSGLAGGGVFVGVCHNLLRGSYACHPAQLSTPDCVIGTKHCHGRAGGWGAVCLNALGWCAAPAKLPPSKTMEHGKGGPGKECAISDHSACAGHKQCPFAFMDLHRVKLRTVLCDQHGGRVLSCGTRPGIACSCMRQ